MPVEPTMPDTFVARHSLTASRSDPGSYVEAILAARLIAGEAVTPAETERLLRNAGLKDEDPTALLASAQSLSRSTEATVLVAAKLSDRDLTDQLAEIAARFRRYRFNDPQPSPSPDLSVLFARIQELASCKLQPTNAAVVPTDPLAFAEAIIAVRIMTGRTVTLDEAATVLRKVGITNGNPANLIQGAETRMNNSGLQLGDRNLYARLASACTHLPAFPTRRLRRVFRPSPDAAQLAQLIKTSDAVFSAILAGGLGDLDPYAGITFTPVAKGMDAPPKPLPVPGPVQQPAAPIPNLSALQAEPTPSPAPAPYCASTEPVKAPAHLIAPVAARDATPEQSPQPQMTTDDARAIVVLAMLNAGVLNDDTLPSDRYQIFMRKPFSEWPKNMQEQLAPYGASLIDLPRTPRKERMSDSGGIKEIEKPEEYDEDTVGEVAAVELEASEEERPRPLPLMTWEDEENGKEGQRNLPLFTDMPTQAERAFILLAREWRESVRSNEPLTNLQVIHEQKILWACLLLAVRWGQTFTSLPTKEAEANQWQCRHKSTYGWLDRHAWDLCEYCLSKTPRSTPPIPAIDKIVAALSHDDSSVRKRVFDFVWLTVSKIPAAYTVAAVQALLKDVAGTLHWHSHAAALASRFFNTRTFFIAYAQQYRPPAEYAKQYAERLAKVERRLAEACTPFVDIENQCWQIITETLLGELFVPFALPPAFGGKDLFPHLAYPEPSSLPALTPNQTGLLSRLGHIWHTRYTRRELDMLVSLPWNQLPPRLKDKIVRYHDDPTSLKRPEDWPTLGTLEEHNEQ